MSRLTDFHHYILRLRANRWHWLFYLFCRLSLAYAFIVAGMVKIVGERFASGLSTLHPMGGYLEALHHTGYYYTFIGVAQVGAAVLLLIPRTVLLGALLYFPIIVNIWVLSFAVRFEGSFVTSPLMVLANLYLLLWHFDRLRFILPLGDSPDLNFFKKPDRYSTRFPWLFFAGVVATTGFTIALALFGFTAMPRNSLRDCRTQFENTPDEAAGFAFCDCVHVSGHPLDDCLQAFEWARE